MQTLRIFISSPGDVAEERTRARQVVESLRPRFANFFYLKPVMWEELPLQADMAFQQGIDLLLSKDHGIDIAIFILWSRLGSALGAVIRKPDGGEYRSGTEREFDMMLQARRQSLASHSADDARPAILVYTRSDQASFDERLRGRSTREQGDLVAQKELVEKFITEEFHDEAGGQNVRAYHNFDQPTDFSKRLRAHLEELLNQMTGQNLAEAVWDIDRLGPPFLGLEAFQPQHAQVFFGRETETLEARHALHAHALNGCAFLLLSGTSGSGKSSLTRAGVLPTILQNEIDNQVAAWRQIIATPMELGPDPLTGLVRHLAADEVLPELRGEGGSSEDFTNGLRRDPALTLQLRFKEAVARASKKQGGGVRVLLVLDQLEELLLTTGPDGAPQESPHRDFFETVEALARSGHVWVLATVRSDFLAAVQAQPALVRMMEGHGFMTVLPPETDALRRLIEEPARLAGLTFERREGQSLADRILRDATHHAELLPLLEYVLRELFEKRTPERMLTWSAYEAMGGVEGALGRSADLFFNALPKDAQSALEEILPRLITVDVSGKQNALRRYAPLSELTSTATQRVLTQGLIAARFLTTDIQPQDHVAVATFAHEALLRRWNPIQQWLLRNRELLQTREHVRMASADWERVKARDAASAEDLLLAPGLPLARGERALDAGTLNATESDFVKRSMAKRDASARKRRWIWRALAAICVVAVVELAVATWIANRKSAQIQRLLAESDVDRSSRLFAEDDASSAVWYLSRAVSSGSAPSEASERLWFALTQRSWPSPVTPALEADTDLMVAGFDAKGERFVTATHGGIVSLYSSADGKMLGHPLPHPKPVRGALFSPDGAKLLTACDDAIVRLWDVRQPEAKLTAEFSHESVVAAISWSPDSKSFASGSWDKHLRVWQVDRPSQPLFSAEMKDKVHTVAFDPQQPSHVLAVAKDEASVWDVNTHEATFRYASSSDLNGACLCSDGTRLLSFTEDGEVTLSDLKEHLMDWTQISLGSSCRSAVLSPDGRRFAVGYETYVEVYSVARPPVKLWQKKFPDDVVAVKFTTDSSRLLVARAAGQVEVFDAAQGRRLAEPISNDGSPVALDFSAAGNRILCAHSRQARIWALAEPRPVPSAAAHLGAKPLDLDAGQNIRCVAANGHGVSFSAGPSPSSPWVSSTFDFGSPLLAAVFQHSGPEVLGADDSGNVMQFAPGQTTPRHLAKLGAPVSQLCFNSRGQLLAAGADDGEVMAWSWPNLAPALPPYKHGDRIGGMAFLKPPVTLLSTSWDHKMAIATHTVGSDSSTELSMDAEPLAIASAKDDDMAAVALANGKIWLVKNAGKTARVEFTVPKPPSSIALSNDAAWLAVGDVAGNITLWNIAKAVVARQWGCSDAGINSISFSSDSRWIATASDSDHSVRVWETNTGNAVTEILPHHAPVSLVRFSADNRSLVSADHSGGVFLWNLETPPQETMIRLATRCLSETVASTPHFVPRPGFFSAPEFANLPHSAWEPAPDAVQDTSSQGPPIGPNSRKSLLLHGQ